MGMLGIPFTLGMATGMIVAGRLYVLKGNYSLALVVFAVAFVGAGICISLTKPLFLLENRAARAEDAA
jgi:hypothetical protein